MEIERAREDLVVAGAAAGTTVVVVLLARIGTIAPPGTIRTLASLFVYFAYLFSRKGGPYGSWDVARNWAALAVLVGVVTLAVAVV